MHKREPHEAAVPVQASMRCTQASMLPIGHSVLPLHILHRPSQEPQQASCSSPWLTELNLVPQGCVVVAAEQPHGGKPNSELWLLTPGQDPFSHALHVLFAACTQEQLVPAPVNLDERFVG